MDIATGVSMTATRRQLPKEEGRQVAERDMHPYFKKKKYRDNGEISSRIRKFHNTTHDKLSIVWIIDCCDQRSTYVVFSLWVSAWLMSWEGELTANGPYTSKEELDNFIFSSVTKP